MPPDSRPPLEELERLLAAATPGPWKSRRGFAPDKFQPKGYKYVQFGPTEAKANGLGTDQLDPANADLIVAAVNALPDLLAAAKREAVLSFSELATISRTRAARWHPGGIEEWAVERWSNAMAGEAGEACNAVKKLNRIEDGIASLGEKGREYSEREEAIAKVLEELADVVIYADLLAQRVGGNLAASIISKFNVVSERYGFPERLQASARKVIPHD